jgi:hypothetical protein
MGGKMGPIRRPGSLTSPFTVGWAYVLNSIELNRWAAPPNSLKNQSRARRGRSACEFYKNIKYFFI